jgi:hypothetical protein
MKANIQVSMSVLLDRGMSVHHVAVAMVTAVEVLDIAVSYLNEAERTIAPPTTSSITWQKLHNL